MEDFAARAQRVVEECAFQEQCRTCGGQVDFGGQMLRDAVISSIQEKGKVVDASTVFCVERVCAEATTPVCRATGLPGHGQGGRSGPKKVLVKHFDVAAVKDVQGVDHNCSDIEVKQEKEALEEANVKEQKAEEEVLSCKDCKSPRVFKTKNGLVKHKKVFCKKTKIIVLGKKDIKCTICGRTFKYRVGLKKHLEKEHRSRDTGDAGPSSEKMNEDMDIEIRENNNDKEKPNSMQFPLHLKMKKFLPLMNSMKCASAPGIAYSQLHG